MMGPLVDAAVGWTLFAGLLLAVGSLAGRWLLVPMARGLEDEPRGWLRTGMARMGLRASLLVLAALVLVLVRQVAEFRDPFAPLSEDLGLLLGSALGRAWYLAVVAALVSVAAFWMAARGSRTGWWIASVGVLAVSVFPGLTGHANGVEELGALALLSDSLHVLAAGAWMGGLAVVLLSERGWRRRNDDLSASLLPELVPAFSPVAVGAVATLVVTGTFAAWLHLPSLDALWTGAYGRLLVAKLALVGGALALGARNFRWLTPRLGQAEGDAALRRSATWELIVANLILLVTAVLVRTSPLGH